MNKNVATFVRNCMTCLRLGYRITRTKNNIIKVVRPYQLWGKYLVRRIDDNNLNNYIIMAAIDHYTKWLETKIINNKTAFKIEKINREQTLQNHGAPIMILSDDGREF